VFDLKYILVHNIIYFGTQLRYFCTRYMWTTCSQSFSLISCEFSL